MKASLSLSLLLGFAAIVFSAETVTDSKPRTNYIPAVPDEAWQHWQYDPETHDYSGGFLPQNYEPVPGSGFRKIFDGAMASVSGNVLVTIVFIGQETGGMYKRSEPPRAFRSQLNLSLIKNFLSGISGIEGAFYEDGKIFLVGKKRQKPGSPVFLPEDIVVAFRAVANDPLRGAAVSIQSGISSGETNMYAPVEYKGLTAQSHLGQVLFEADRLLKSIGLGCDNITRKPLTVDRWWHQTKFDFMDPSKSSQSEEWHRFWFLSEGMKIHVDKQKKILQFKEDVPDVVVQKTRKGEDFYLDRSDTRAPGKYAENFKKNFSYYKKEFPALQEFTEIAKLVGIARWLYENGILMKFEKENVKGFYGWYTPEKTPAFQVTHTRVVKTVDLRLYQIKEFEINSVGGVDLTRFQFQSKNLGNERENWNDETVFSVLRLF